MICLDMKRRFFAPPIECPFSRSLFSGRSRCLQAKAMTFPLRGLPQSLSKTLY